jgi:hypothetical protein
MTSNLFLKVPLVITKQLVITMQRKLFFNNSSRIPTQVTKKIYTTVYVANTNKMLLLFHGTKQNVNKYQTPPSSQV